MFLRFSVSIDRCLTAMAPNDVAIRTSQKLGRVLSAPRKGAVSSAGEDERHTHSTDPPGIGDGMQA
jgi:hypothetical protein